ncbi:MAG: RNA-guided pseudouridylation complex pseudouridine synthase subunit Cbf5 [Candidatus Thermoplasmatota archaeon]|nr:RNA-guided pseudouridylation complex pseudouridine synthase subunit Cbf5 [Candidatus Thermoplasmatota archaeon]
MSGWRPEDRPMDIHLKYGFVALDKPAGPTSHQVSSWVRDILGLDKAGHAGTLDPGVTGVLAVAMNNSLRAVEALHTGYKEYAVVATFHREVKEPEVKEIFEEFTGEIYQIPPVRSAVKRQLRTREIYRMKFLEMDGRDVLFRVLCESGTYIRTLCYDMGDALGVGANMSELRRTRTADITEKDLVTLHDLIDAWKFWKEDGDESWLRKAVKPMERMFSHLPGLEAKDSAIDALCHGASLAAPGLSSVLKDYNQDQLIAIYSQKGEAVILARATVASIKARKMKEGVIAEPVRVLMDTGTYPPGWKKH